MTTQPRKALPEDSEFLTWAILTASRGHAARGPWDVLLPDEERLKLLLEYLVLSEVPSYFQWSHFHVCEVEGRPASALAAFDPGGLGTTSLVPAISDGYAALGWDEAELVEGLKRLDAFRTCAPELSPGTWVLEWVATLPERRRLGLVQGLLDAAFEEGRERGNRAQISIMIGNDPAKSAYEKIGFRPAEEKRHPEFERVFGVPGILRMTKELSALLMMFAHAA